MIKVLYTKDRTECGNFRVISLVAHPGKDLLFIVATGLSAYCEAKGQLPEEQCGFRPHLSTTDIMSVVRRLQELGRKALVPLFHVFRRSAEGQRFCRPYTSLSDARPLRSTAETYQAIDVIDQLHEGMRTFGRNDDVCSKWFEVT